MHSIFAFKLNCVTKTSSLFANWIFCAHHYMLLPCFSVISLLGLHARSFSLALTVCRNFTGDVVSLFAGTEYASKAALVRYRVKKFAHACIRAVYGNRFNSIPSFLLDLLSHMKHLNFIWLVLLLSLSNTEKEIYLILLSLKFKTKLFV